MCVYVCENDAMCASGNTKEGCNAVYGVGVRHHCVFAKYCDVGKNQALTYRVGDVAQIPQGLQKYDRRLVLSLMGVIQPRLKEMALSDF